MLSIPGRPGATCDGMSRRELMRVGGAGLLGLSLSQLLTAEARGQDAPAGKKRDGFGGAKNFIFVFLQGGPSHLDIWDPKPDAPDNIRGDFKVLPTKIPGVNVTEVMPNLAKVLDKTTLIRSVSYTPAGLFNHTAAIYQMMTGYTPDKVSPSGQLEPPNRADYPHMGSQLARLMPPKEPMLPFVMLPRPLQESNVIGKGGTAGFLGAAYDPYYMFQDPNDKVSTVDLSLRSEVNQGRMERRASLLQKVDAAMPDIEKAVSDYALDTYDRKALELILSGRARKAFNLEEEPKELRDKYGRHTFGQSLLLARRLIEAGSRVVQVNWPAVANGNPTVDAWDTHADNFGPLKNLHCPKLDSGLPALIEDLDSRGMLKDTIVLAIGEFGRSPKMGVSTSGNTNSAKGRDHWPYCYTGLMAGGGIARGAVYGKSDKTGSSPAENPVHPTELLATVYHALGVDPTTLVNNHLGQPRELVQAKPVISLFG
ncbi:MAG: hypothetical protein JWP03_2934 [Phycisphaerales bacterium]|jgi:uncharacterized protein (DUF1501 family)|nr:hypothetical protein [Phycisphaerales bacterium]